MIVFDQNYYTNSTQDGETQLRSSVSRDDESINQLTVKLNVAEAQKSAVEEELRHTQKQLEAAILKIESDSNVQQSVAKRLEAEIIAHKV